ncbi:MAG: ribonuclease Z [Candidatus Methanomethylophilaceae archaeon]|nr:ribonuclease Z [Candidatus Methanomethylophilaceae archaeon]
MLELLFLGTGAGVPSRQRATSCVAVRNGSDIFLFDCGEGSQRQMMISPFSFMKIRAIFITHLHGDHVFGLPGLLQTMSLSGRKDPVKVYGPKGIANCVETFMSVTEGDTVYPLEVEELAGGESFEIGNSLISTYPTVHGIPSVGYVIKEKDHPGKLDREKALSLGIADGPDMARLKNGETVKGVSPEQVIGEPVKGVSISYTGDTMPCDSVIEGSAGVTVLVHESTYMSDAEDLAKEHFHSTAAQAAEAAKACGASHLILTHLSHRYRNPTPVENEARKIFPSSYAAADLQLYEVRPDGITVRL